MATRVRRIPGDLGFEFTAMASACEVRIAGIHRREAQRAAQAAIDEVRRIEVKFSRYRQDGVVPLINRSAGLQPVACDEETMALLRYAATLFDASDGLFDATSGVLRKAWDFRVKAVPTRHQIDALLPLVGWSGVELGEDSVRLPRAGMELDFGGFGKEYAVDRACAVLIERGVHYGFVNLGGDLRAIGPQPDGMPWSMGIQDPRDTRAVAASLPLSVGSLATSGDYERFMEIDGRRYCHILNPRTGMPVSAWRSLSVLAPVAIAAGSYSTIGMLRESGAPEWLDANEVAWLGVDRDGVVHRGAHRPDVSAASISRG